MSAIIKCRNSKVKESTSSSGFTCSICSKKFRTQKTFDIHKTKFHFKGADLSKLPNEILALILSYLDSKGILGFYTIGKIEPFLDSYNHIWTDRLQDIEGGKFMYLTSYGLTCLKYENRLCFDCMKPGKKSVFYDDIRFCQKCKDDNHPLITKTTVLTKYGLKKEDLVNLKHVSIDNPYYKCAPEMILFSKNQVENYVRKKEEKNKLDPIMIERASKQKARLEKLYKLAENNNLKDFTRYLSYNMSRETALEVCREHARLAIELHERYGLYLWDGNGDPPKLAVLDCDEYSKGYVLDENMDLDTQIDHIVLCYWMENYTDYFSHLESEINNAMSSGTNVNKSHIVYRVRRQYAYQRPSVFPWMD